MFYDIITAITMYPEICQCCVKPIKSYTIFCPECYNLFNKNYQKQVDIKVGKLEQENKLKSLLETIHIPANL